MSISNLNDEKTHMVTCFFISMLVGREKERGSYKNESSYSEKK